MTERERWRIFWQGKTRPFHARDTDEHYRPYAAELRLLFADSNPLRILEIGCGNGALYKHLGFENMQYKGVDFSASMLKVFKAKHPDVELECADGSTYQDEDKYDLIFSNGVIQHFDINMLHRHFSNVTSMLKPTSLFVCASIPWKARRFEYYAGKLTDMRVKFILFGFRAYLPSRFRGKMGAWYSLQDIRKFASAHRMSVAFYGSMHYLYRFHAVMRLFGNP